MPTSLLDFVTPGAVSAAANAIAVLCIIPYCWAIWRRRITPPPATWAIWAAAGVVGSIGIAIAGGDRAAWTLKLALSVGPAAAAIVGLSRGLPLRATRTDTVCLGLSVIGMVFLLFGQGLPALFLSIVVNIIGTPPTLLHGWRRPREESYFPFACAFLSVAAVLVTIPWPWTLASSAYGLYLLFDTALIMATVAAGRARMRRLAAGRRWLVLVDPAPDEAERLADEPWRADAGLGWLEDGEAEGWITAVDSYANEDGTPKTGGYMIVAGEDRAALEARLATYPLLATIDTDERPLNRRLPDGFQVLRADVAAARRRAAEDTAGGDAPLAPAR